VNRANLISLALMCATVTAWMACRAPVSSRSTSPDQARAEVPADLRDLRLSGNKLYGSGQYLQAIRIYESGYEQAMRRSQFHAAILFLNNVGGARYAMFQYRDALKAYLEARNLAERSRDKESLSAICLNLSSLYYFLDDLEAASQAAAEGLSSLGDADTVYKPKLLLQSALLEVARKNPQAGIGLLERSIEAARQQQDTFAEAQSWNELGNVLLDQGRLKESEDALIKALHRRKAADDDRIHFSYESLGKLRMRQGNVESALACFDRAINATGPASGMTAWTAYYERGRAKLAQHRFEEAFGDFSAAVNWARRWGAQVLPADAFRVGTEVELHQVYSAFLELGSELYVKTGQNRFAEEAFAAAEESRAASLRSLWAGSDALNRKLPPEYWETLSRLQKLETGMLGSKNAAAADGSAELRTRLSEMEAQAGLDDPISTSDAGTAPRDLLQRTRRALRSDEAYFGFHLGEAESWLWVVARDGFELRRLPPRAVIARSVKEFERALSGNRPEAGQIGQRLYAQLFAGVRKPLIEKPVWILGLDGVLFEIPFAALVEDSQITPGRRLYVMERHALEVTPGVMALIRSSSTTHGGAVAGLGDAIYNRADVRWKRPRPKMHFWPWGRATEVRTASQLSRLAGSTREINNCARIWRTQGVEPTILTGASASKQNLIEVLRTRPSIVHVAAHVVFPANATGAGLIALTLQPDGNVEFLSATEIANMRVTLGLVVLNGCSSADGQILPGTGLMGMTRAWLAAGARAVITRRWPMADDSGELFQSFYQHLGALGNSIDRGLIARALQQAQVDQLRAGGWQSSPAYWSAYSCVVRN
jgi:CHAT domain-containing protein